MASIYENAHITLAGEPSEDGQGLFHGCSDYTSLEIAGLHTSADAPIVEMRRLVNSRSHCSFLSRGWVFQESQLSKRFVTFAPNELVWDCFSESRCECRGVYEDRARVKFLPPLGNNYEWGDQLLPWCGKDGIVEQFTRKELTKVEDRLPALAGLASRYRYHNGNLKYVAGLWLETLGRGDIFWTASCDEPAPRPEHLFAPTWSWASIATPVQFRYATGYPELHIWLTGWEIRSVKGGNEYGRLEKAHLRVGGIGISGKLVAYNKHRTMFSNSVGFVQVDGIRETIPFAADYDLCAASKYQVSIPSEVLFLFGYYTETRFMAGSHRFPFYPGGMVLRCIDAEEGYYEKIGIFDAYTLSSIEDRSVQAKVGVNYIRCFLKAGHRQNIIIV
ncbi:hypothetical protein FPOA_06741 [Fusarium poae]|uniref:Heterokaryon incompatibility domain-containing protein n=1 Tax=Fusarium poae TaxID=36050 RepID=A0A1B8AII0_FUSPO|nr:hypothetical protein FPOA_06741 [Fusarium poae]